MWHKHNFMILKTESALQNSELGLFKYDVGAMHLPRKVCVFKTLSLCILGRPDFLKKLQVTFFGFCS